MFPVRANLGVVSDILVLTWENVHVLGEERDRGLFDVDRFAPGLIDPDSIYGFLARSRSDLFPEHEFADLFPSRTGRPSIPASVMATAL